MFGTDIEHLMCKRAVQQGPTKYANDKNKSTLSHCICILIYINKGATKT